MAKDEPATPISTGGDDGGLPERVSEDLGGVQGSAPDESGSSGDAASLTPAQPDDQPAPDAGEIEWAGQVVKKPPTPDAS